MLYYCQCSPNCKIYFDIIQACQNYRLSIKIIDKRYFLCYHTLGGGNHEPKNKNHQNRKDLQKHIKGILYFKLYRLHRIYRSRNNSSEHKCNKIDFKNRMCNYFRSSCTVCLFPYRSFVEC